jgi:FkbM family methyltransferase
MGDGAVTLGLLRLAASRLRTRPLLGRWALRMIPDIPWTLRVDGIGPFRIRLRRNRSLWLRRPLESESFPFAVLRRFVRPGDVVYDAGANLGLYARYLVETLGAGRVIAFEPSAGNRALLAANLGLAGIASQVTVLPIALADEDGMLEFQVDDVQSASGTLTKVTGGGPSLGRRNLGLGPLTEQVLCRRLDAVVAEEDLPPPDVIKIDVEGAEAFLLRGAMGLLRERRPRLLVELHGAAQACAVLAILDVLGYSCAARVSPQIDASGFARVDSTLLPRITGLYDVHFIAAASDPADLPSRSELPDG